MIDTQDLSQLAHERTPMTRKRGQRWTCPRCTYTRAYRGKSAGQPFCHGLMTFADEGSFSFDLADLGLREDAFKGVKSVRPAPFLKGV